MPEADAATILEINADARLGALRNAFGLTALLTAAALLFTGRLPRQAPGSSTEPRRATAAA